MSLDIETKTALIERFSAWLDAADAPDLVPDDPGEGADFHAIFVELAGLRTELRAESRLVKDALDQFRSVFDTLQSSNAGMAKALEALQSAARERERNQLRGILLDMIDLRDRLTAGLKAQPALKPVWYQRFLPAPSAEAVGWREGLAMTLRRLDQTLAARGVVPIDMLGHVFDPRLGQAIATRSDPAIGPGIVLEEIRTGFRWDEDLLRPAELVVNKLAAGVAEP